MLVLFLLTKQSRDLCTVEVLEEESAGRTLLLWVSAVIKHLFPSQGTCHHLRCPWRESLRCCWCLEMEIPSAGGQEMETVVQVSRNYLFFPISTHGASCSACPLPPERGTPRGTLATWRLHRIKFARCQRTTAAPDEQGQGWCSGRFPSDVCVAWGQTVTGVSLCVCKGVKEKSCVGSTFVEFREQNDEKI